MNKHFGKKRSPNINTRLVQGGNYDPYSYHGFINPPIVHASTVLFPDSKTFSALAQKYTYATHGTPTTDALCEAINVLEDAVGTVLVPSGLAAATVPFLAFLSPGDHALITDSIYYPTRHFADTVLTRLGIEVEYYDPTIGAEIMTLLQSNTKVIFTESPGSNTFEVQDIPAIVAKAHEAGAIVMLDNTWATPIYFKPFDFGVDISIHAATKYPSGHSDLLFGTISAREQCWPVLKETHSALGLCVGADDAYQVLRGLRTMGLRLDHQNKNALHIARWLEKQPGVAQVLHPALESHAGHVLWKRDFKGSSGVFSIVLNGDKEECSQIFLDRLEIFGIGYSWGGYTSLAVPVDLRDRKVSRRNYSGPIIRLQIGLEDIEDLIFDLQNALEAVKIAE